MDVTDIVEGSILVIGRTEEGEIDGVSDSYGGKGRLVTIGSREWYIYDNREDAGAEAAEYWEDMAEGDAGEFAAIIGSERLIQWGLGKSDEYGISSVQEFAERNADVPEENWASYDSQECEAYVRIPVDEEGDPCDRTYEEDDDGNSIENFVEIQVVAYRHN